MIRFSTISTNAIRSDRAQLRSELFASHDVAINHARTGLSARDIADHLERRVELMRLADLQSRGR